MKRKEKYGLNGYILTNLLFEDLKNIKNWRNKQIKILRQKNILADKDQEKYWKKIQNDKTSCLFSILNTKEELIGYCGLTHIDKEYSRAEISFLLNPKYKEGTKIFGEIFINVLKMLCNHGFNKLRLNKIFSETYEFRKQVIKIVEKSGMKKDGVLREHVFKNGKFYDSVMHSILKKEFREK